MEGHTAPALSQSTPNWFVRLWNRIRRGDSWTVRYFIAYDFRWKASLNSAEQLSMGHCVLDVRGGIDSWEKVCGLQTWIHNSIMVESGIPIITKIRINNFIPINRYLS